MGGMYVFFGGKCDLLDNMVVYIWFCYGLVFFEVVWWMDFEMEFDCVFGFYIVVICEIFEEVGILLVVNFNGKLVDGII